MPITPLHFGVLAPVNHWFPGKVSLASFTLVNLIMDGNAIAYFIFGIYQPELHAPTTHSLMAAVVWGSFIALFGCLSKKWILGAYFGAVTHILLDMLIHTDMSPLFPLEGNPFALVPMTPLSLLLVPFTVWFIVQCVSDGLGHLRRLTVAFPFGKRPPDL